MHSLPLYPATVTQCHPVFQVKCQVLTPAINHATHDTADQGFPLKMVSRITYAMQFCIKGCLIQPYPRISCPISHSQYFIADHRTITRLSHSQKRSHDCILCEYTI